MKISIITATLNNKAGLMRAIESVRSQTYKNIEHIVVDGGSTDRSVETLKNLQFTIYNLLFISEADTGIYDAINKGIRFATGDVIGLLHSDDFYKDEFVVEKVVEAFALSAKSIEQSAESKAPFVSAQGDEVDAVYSDLVYVMEKSKVKSQKSKNEYIDHSGFKIDPPRRIEHSIIRYWKAHKIKKDILTTHYLPAGRQGSPLTTQALLNGWMPPHPTLFVKKEIFDKYGLYRTDMKIAADYEMVLRLFYKYKISSNYLPLTTYSMTIGGASNKSLSNIIIKSKEDYRSMKLHSIPFPLKTLLIKNLSKLQQFFYKN